MPSSTGETNVTRFQYIQNSSGGYIEGIGSPYPACAFDTTVLQQAAAKKYLISLMIAYANVRNHVTALNRQINKQYSADKISNEVSNMKAI